MVLLGSVPRGREELCASQNRRAGLGAAGRHFCNAERASDIDTRGFTSRGQTRAGALRDQGRCLGGSLSRKYMGNAAVAPLGPNQVDIVSEQICCEDPAWWTFKQAASHPVPHLLAPYMSQAEYSGALAGAVFAVCDVIAVCARRGFVASTTRSRRSARRASRRST